MSNEDKKEVVEKKKSEVLSGEVTAISERQYKKNIIIESLNKGSTVMSACDGAGIHHDTYYEWYRKDKVFAGKVYEAKLSRVEIVEDAIYKSAVKGDTRAGMFILINRGDGKWHSGNNPNITIHNTNRIDEGNKYDKHTDDFFEGESLRRRQAVSLRIDKKSETKS